mmetsp:Transcript_13466/g.20801  ORF Transcript_13466/g.20801 Transcript_13466/m.20801 type:complete len:133 (+) Transcript_13466:541-939(+)
MGGKNERQERGEGGGKLTALPRRERGMQKQRRGEKQATDFERKESGDNKKDKDLKEALAAYFGRGSNRLLLLLCHLVLLLHLLLLGRLPSSSPSHLLHHLLHLLLYLLRLLPATEDVIKSVGMIMVFKKFPF